LGTFREKDFVTEFGLCLRLASLDQISVGFKDGIDFFVVGNLLSIGNTTARLIDHTLSQFTVMVDFLPEFTDGHVGGQILAARFPGRCSTTFCALLTTSSVIPMSSQYFSVCRSCRCLDVIRWISCIRRLAVRVRLQNPRKRF
jgi:hypothetical protein